MLLILPFRKESEFVFFFFLQLFLRPGKITRNLAQSFASSGTLGDFLKKKNFSGSLGFHLENEDNALFLKVVVRIQTVR